MKGTGIKHLIHCLDSTAAAKSLQSCPTLCDPIDGPLRGHKECDMAE